MSSTILPIHPVTGLTALGITKRGRPIWPVIGGNGEGDGNTADDTGSEDAGDEDEGDEDTDSDEDTDTENDSDNDSDDADDDGADALGDKGKRALDKMKAKLKSEKAARVAAESRVAQLEGGDDENAQQQREAEAAAIAKANAKIVKAEVRAAASGKLADPRDALNFIDLEQFDVDEDGDVDQEEIADAIEDLIRRKPYLAAQSGTTKTPKPDRSQGARGKGSRSVEQQFSDAMQSLL